MTSFLEFITLPQAAIMSKTTFKCPWVYLNDTKSYQTFDLVFISSLPSLPNCQILLWNNILLAKTPGFPATFWCLHCYGDQNGRETHCRREPSLISLWIDPSHFPGYYFCWRSPITAGSLLVFELSVYPSSLSHLGLWNGLGYHLFWTRPHFHSELKILVLSHFCPGGYEMFTFRLRRIPNGVRLEQNEVEGFGQFTLMEIFFKNGIVDMWLSSPVHNLGVRLLEFTGWLSHLLIMCL